MKSNLSNKKVMVVGACGSVGSELVRQLLTEPQYSPEEVIGLDNNEGGLFFLDQEWLSDSRAHFFLADIRDKVELSRRMRGIDVVIHAAALKHVILCERSPDQAVSTNIHGVQNVISAAIENKVEKVIFTSSDKAVNPTNVMGTSKLMGERLMTAANSQKRGHGPIFASTRFGNVLGSSGSVIPIFSQQISNGGPVTLTHSEMTRFVMTLKESVKLLLDSSEIACGGEVFITKMPVVRIQDLATVMISAQAPNSGFDPKDIEISIIGTKPGEKLYEELMSEEETRRTLELDKYYSVLPAFRGIYNDIQYNYPAEITKDIEAPYTSSQQIPLTQEEIRELLRLVEPSGEAETAAASRYWPGDKEVNN